MIRKEQKDAVIAGNRLHETDTGSNPRQPSNEEMEKLLKACFYDEEIDF